MKNLYRWSMLIVARLLVPEGFGVAVRPIVRLKPLPLLLLLRLLGAGEEEKYKRKVFDESFHGVRFSSSTSSLLSSSRHST